MPSRNSLIIAAVYVVVGLLIGVYAGYYAGSRTARGTIAELKIEVANLKDVNKTNASWAELQEERAKELMHERDNALQRCRQIERTLDIVYKTTIAIEKVSPSKQTISPSDR